MFKKSFSIAIAMGCCGCFGFIRKFERRRNQSGFKSNLSQEPLLDETEDRDDDGSYNGDITDIISGDDSEVPICTKRSEEILMLREEKDMICRQFPVKETHKVVRGEVIGICVLPLRRNFSIVFHISCQKLYVNFIAVSG